MTTSSMNRAGAEPSANGGLFPPSDLRVSDHKRGATQFAKDLRAGVWAPEHLNRPQREYARQPLLSPLLAMPPKAFASPCFPDDSPDFLRGLAVAFQIARGLVDIDDRLGGRSQEFWAGYVSAFAFALACAAMPAERREKPRRKRSHTDTVIARESGVILAPNVDADDDEPRSEGERAA